MRLEKVLPLRSRRNRQLLISIVEIQLRKIEAILLQHLQANRRSRAVTADHHVGFIRRCFSRLLVAQMRRAALEIDSSAALLKVNLSALRLSSGNERHVQLGS